MINVKEETLKRHNLSVKALAWVTAKSIKAEQATIQQLAQSLRVPVKTAQDIVGFLMRGQADTLRLAQTYQIFVQGNQVPDWMRPHLSGLAIAAILRMARNTNVTTMQRDLHRQVLAEAYGDKFKAYVTESYNQAANSVMDALDQSGIDQKVYDANFDGNPQLKQLGNPDWAVRSPVTGAVGLNINFTGVQGTEVSLHFGSLQFDTIENAKYSDAPDLMHSKYGRSNDLPEDLDAKLKQVEKFISEMQSKGYGFVRLNRMFKSSGNRNHHTTVVFTKNSDLGLTIRVVLPWVNVMLDEV